MDILKAPMMAKNGSYHINLLHNILDREMEMPLLYGKLSAPLYSTAFEMLDMGQSSNATYPKTP